uniref:SLATT domain-containing protein n=1 Tax=viral metagenome TaxID=1070528 RepID=A0A6C0BP29_9ZZZZ
MEDPQVDHPVDVSIAMVKRGSISASLHDRPRQEEPWTHNIERVFSDLQEELKQHIDNHNKAGYHFHDLDTRWGYPGAILSLMMVPISALIDSCDEDLTAKIVNAAAYSVIAVLVGTSQYYNYGKRSQTHFDISARYADVMSDIRMELAKRAQYRQSADNFLQKIQMRIDSLNSSAPILPKHIGLQEISH